ncbi:hypothetical protein LguiB_004927 [Lonicera macranthoides]
MVGNFQHRLCYSEDDALEDKRDRSTPRKARLKKIKNKQNTAPRLLSQPSTLSNRTQAHSSSLTLSNLRPSHRHRRTSPLPTSQPSTLSQAQLLFPRQVSSVNSNSAENQRMSSSNSGWIAAGGSTNSMGEKIKEIPVRLLQTEGPEVSGVAEKHAEHNSAENEDRKGSTMRLNEESAGSTFGNRIVNVSGLCISLMVCALRTRADHPKINDPTLHIAVYHPDLQVMRGGSGCFLSMTLIDESSESAISDADVDGIGVHGAKRPGGVTAISTRFLSSFLLDTELLLKKYGLQWR